MSLPGIILPLTIILLGTCHCENTCSFNDVLQITTKLPGSDVRPVRNWKSPTTVRIDLFLYAVISLDTSLQTLTTYIWFSMAWNNEFLSWNPDDFCGIKNILIPNNNFWFPDLYIYEMTESDSNIPVIPYFSVSSNGTITNSKPLKSRIISSCNLDIYKFPFDVQACTLSFGPYIHTVNDIIMVAKSNSSQVFQNSQDIFVSKGDWSLLDITVQNETFSTGNMTYSQVIYQISVRRAPVVYIINLIIPACFMVLLDIASMFIQMATGERLGFKITVVLGFSVLLLILNSMLPNSDNPPVLGIFCCVCLAVMVVSIIGSIGTSYMLMLSENQPNVPPWIKIWIMKNLARILFFKVKAHQRDDLVSVETAVKDNRNYKKTETCMTIEMRKTDTQKDIRIPVEVKILKRLLAEVLKIRQEMKYSKDQDDVKSDWHFAAMVVDRLVLIVYLLIVIVMFAVVITVWTT
ncbi:5-hydroxytryptamine receptor 3A-like [Rhinoderma darwinii]|uniref:5-hydroxytryptamine receptor 3A-like n=1 Tax=Rhinoderma darwinii TaxID=43563 RepID=UPI003F66B32B